jgi:hypothetical protein
MLQPQNQKISEVKRNKITARARVKTTVHSNKKLST